MPRPSKGARLGRAAGSSYFYLYWTEDGKQRRCSTGTGDLSEAQRRLAELTLRLAAGTSSGGPVPPERFPIARALNVYLTDRARTLKSAWLQATHAEKFIKFFGDGTVDFVTKASVNRYIETRRLTPGLKGRTGISDSAIRRELAVLQVALNHCAREGLLTRAPHVYLPRQSPGRETWINHDEAAVLLDCMREPHLRLFTLIALYTGARKAAILDLTWPQIDFQDRLVYLNPPGRAQTSKRRPTVPLTGDLLAALSAAQTTSKSPTVIAYKGARVGDLKKAFRAATERAAAVFRKLAAEEQDERRKEALLASAAKFKDVTPHVLRHTAGSWMIQAGVPIGKIAHLLGHTEQKTTALYAHLHPDYLRDAAEAISTRARAGASFLQVARNSPDSAQNSVIKRQASNE